MPNNKIEIRKKNKMAKVKVQCCDCLHHTCKNACLNREACNGTCKILKDIKVSQDRRNCYSERYCDYFEYDKSIKQYINTLLNIE